MKWFSNILHCSEYLFIIYETSDVKGRACTNCAKIWGIKKNNSVHAVSIVNAIIFHRMWLTRCGEKNIALNISSSRSEKL